MKRLTTSQISEWEAYDKLEPIGTYWADYRMAYLCSFITNTIHSLYAEEGKRPEYVMPTDFMAIYDREELKTYIESTQKQQSLEDMKQALLSIAATQNKKVERRVRKVIPKGL